jgi:hypothetical protein
VGHHGQGIEGDTAVAGGVGVRVGTTEALRWLKTLRASVLSVGQWFRGSGVVGHHMNWMFYRAADPSGLE